MTTAIKTYLADGGSDYLASPDYERRRLALADKLAAGPVSFADMATMLGLPLAVVVDLYSTWRTEAAAAASVKH